MYMVEQQKKGETEITWLQYAHLIIASLALCLENLLAVVVVVVVG